MKKIILGLLVFILLFESMVALSYGFTIFNQSKNANDAFFVFVADPSDPHFAGILGKAGTPEAVLQVMLGNPFHFAIRLEGINTETFGIIKMPVQDPYCSYPMFHFCEPMTDGMIIR